MCAFWEGPKGERFIHKKLQPQEASNQFKKNQDKIFFFFLNPATEQNKKSETQLFPANTHRFRGRNFSFPSVNKRISQTRYRFLFRTKNRVTTVDITKEDIIF